MTDIIKRHEWPLQKTGRALRGIFRIFLSLGRQATALMLALTLVLVNAQSFVAFESHIVDIHAEIAQIDPPSISPPGGGVSAALQVGISDPDTDATHIFYTITPGTDVNTAPDPTCGSILGGPKDIAPFTVSGNTVIKAVACNGPTPDALSSTVSVEVYIFPEGYDDSFIHGHKYFDANQNGIFDEGDYAIAGWKVSLSTATSSEMTVTNQDGYYEFSNLTPNTYLVTEETRPGWVHTAPKDSLLTVRKRESHEVNFFNYDTGYACVPQKVDFPAGLAVQTAGQASEHNDDVALAANVTVNGDVRSNDDIERINAASNVHINGSATSSDQIDSGITVSKVKLSGAPSANLPDIMISDWETHAKDGGTVAGSFIFPSGTSGLLLGPSEILGNLGFGSSNAATIKGPLYIHGNLTIGSNTTITEDPVFGNQFLPIIVDGTVSINSNVSFVKAGTRGAFLLVSTHGAVAGDAAAIETNSNNSDLGDVVLYASNGDIHVRSNRTLLAAFATHGNDPDSDANAAVRLDSNVTVHYRTLPDTISCGQPQPYETTSHVVINEFMPNPVGADQGTAGAPLDGEWVELFNPGSSPVDVTGWVLYDTINTHALPIAAANTNTGDTTVPSHGFLVVYRDGNTVFELNNSGGDTVRLLNGPIGSGGALIDSVSYTITVPEGKSFARIPDGSANWIDPDSTPGETNVSFLAPLDGSNTPPGLEETRPPLELGETDVDESLLPPVPKDTTKNSDDKISKDEKAKTEEPVVAALPQDTAIDGGSSGGTPPIPPTLDGIISPTANSQQESTTSPAEQPQAVEATSTVSSETPTASQRLEGSSTPESTASQGDLHSNSTAPQVPVSVTPPPADNNTPTLEVSSHQAPSGTDPAAASPAPESNSAPASSETIGGAS